MIRNKDPARELSRFIFIIKVKGRGINKITSISNTKKITASKKNRVENGKRAVFLGSKPHSKGDAFSRSGNERTDEAETRKEVIIMTAGIAAANINIR